jgi:hypothetical protein
MRIPLRSLVGLVLVVLLTSCDLTTAPGRGDLRASVRDGTLLLMNRSRAPIFFFAIDQDMAALANWAPCTNPGTCPPVLPGAQMAVPQERIAGFGFDGRQNVLVYWWYLVPRNGELTPDTIRVVGVQM